LLGAYVQGKDNVDKKTLIKASQEIFGAPGTLNKGAVLRWMAAGVVLLGCVTAIAISFYSQRMHRTEKTEGFPVAASMGTGSGKAEKMEWPLVQPVKLSREMAYQALLREWNLSDMTPMSDNICKQVMAKGIRCLDGSITLKALLNLNRPAVLKLFDDKGKEFYATVKGVEGQRIVLVVGGETKTVDFQEIEKRWLGDYLLLWKAPVNYKGIIRPGDKGPQIVWIDRYVSLSGNKQSQVRTSNLYDLDLVKRVKRFQLSEGVIPDGVVGPQTIIHLINRQGTKEPLLTANNKGRK
jgi:general secretion pathway protein A